MARKGKEITQEEKKIILRLHEQKKSYRDIGKILNRSRYTIRNIVKKFKNKESLINRRRSGRPRKLTIREERVIIRNMKKKPKITSTELKAILGEQFNVDVHQETIRRALRRAGFSSRIARKKPSISKKNKKLRKKFANDYLPKENEFWDKVLFSDESKYNIFKCDGRVRVWRRPNTEFDPSNVQQTVKHGGGGVLVWGCMASAGVGELVFIDSIMDKHIYLDILKNNLAKSAEKLKLGNDWYFQQDNDPKHTAYTVRQWIVYNTPHTLPTPPQSPDLNPIEHLWDELERRIRKHHITSKSMLKEILKEEWTKIEPETTRKLVHSMHSRIIEVLRRKGQNTSY